ncbi:M48 family metallopeptidase [Kitasatospora sp. NPDC002227]|uniref:M48 family metallopeptidase n=1 Tax=Kitasatospora sp. NPDC002227 TaxID=3154773 RepID=UPI003331B14F
MSTPVLHGTRACPSCGTDLPDSGNHVSWCPACEWNLSPAPIEATPHRTRRQQRKAARAERREEARKKAVRARVEQLYDALAADPAGRGGSAGLAALTLATLIHLASLVAFAGCAALLALGTLPLRAVGLLGLAVLAVGTRPSLGRAPERGTVLARDKAPALYGLADRVAQVLGAQPVHLIRTNGRFNASFGRVGLRRRSVLTIGIPLWQALTPQQRVALLAHELGHSVNGDTRRGLWLGSALATLDSWYRILRPARVRRASTLDVLSKALLRPGAWLVERLLLLLDRLTTRSGQAAEYRADALAATTASTEAARGMLETLLLGTSARTVLDRFRNSAVGRAGSRQRQQQPADLWTALGDHLAAVPRLERERLLRVSIRELGAVDVSHPPTYLRLRMLDHRPVTEAAVVLGTAEGRAVEAELAPARARVAANLLG